MPDPHKFTTDFGFIKGNTYAGYLLENIISCHEIVIKYKEYRYYIELFYKIVSPSITPQEFFDQHVFEDRIITTEYGNPYKCHLQKYNYEVENDTIKIILEGYSERI